MKSSSKMTMMVQDEIYFDSWDRLPPLSSPTTIEERASLSSFSSSSSSSNSSSCTSLSSLDNGNDCDDVVTTKRTKSSSSCGTSPLTSMLLLFYYPEGKQELGEKSTFSLRMTHPLRGNSRWILTGIPLVFLLWCWVPMRSYYTITTPTPTPSFDLENYFMMGQLSPLLPRQEGLDLQALHHPQLEKQESEISLNTSFFPIATLPSFQYNKNHSTTVLSNSGTTLTQGVPTTTTKTTTTTKPSTMYLPGAGFSGFWYTLGALYRMYNFPETTQEFEATTSSSSSSSSSSLPPPMEYYCYSAGCLAATTILQQTSSSGRTGNDGGGGNEVGLTPSSVESLLELAQVVQSQWLSGQVSQYDVVSTFVNGLLLLYQQDNDNVVYDGDNEGKEPEWLSRIHIITATTTPSSTSSTSNILPQIIRSQVTTPKTLKELKQLLIQTTWIPIATGTSLFKDGHMDGAFSVLWDPVLQYTNTEAKTTKGQEDTATTATSTTPNCCTMSLSLPITVPFLGQALNFLMSPTTARTWYEEGWNKGFIH